MLSMACWALATNFGPVLTAATICVFVLDMLAQFKLFDLFGVRLSDCGLQEKCPTFVRALFERPTTGDRVVVGKQNTGWCNEWSKEEQYEMRCDHFRQKFIPDEISRARFEKGFSKKERLAASKIVRDIEEEAYDAARERNLARYELRKSCSPQPEWNNNNGVLPFFE